VDLLPGWALLQHLIEEGGELLLVFRLAVLPTPFPVLVSSAAYSESVPWR